MKIVFRLAIFVQCICMFKTCNSFFSHYQIRSEHQHVNMVYIPHCYSCRNINFTLYLPRTLPYHLKNSQEDKKLSSLLAAKRMEKRVTVIEFSPEALSSYFAFIFQKIRCSSISLSAVAALYKWRIKFFEFSFFAGETCKN